MTQIMITFGFSLSLQRLNRLKVIHKTFVHIMEKTYSILIKKTLILSFYCVLFTRWQHKYLSSFEFAFLLSSKRLIMPLLVFLWLFFFFFKLQTLSVINQCVRPTSTWWGLHMKNGITELSRLPCWQFDMRQKTTSSKLWWKLLNLLVYTAD